MTEIYVILVDGVVWSYNKNKEELYTSYLKLRKKMPTFYKLYKNKIKILTFVCMADITDKIEREMDNETIR